MKSYKQLLSEVAASAISGGKGGPSLGPATDGDFGSIRGLGINTGDSITANLSGKGFGKKQTTKDITPEITAAIEAGKADGSIEEDENGKLSYRGVNGELHNSPYAANEASTSFVKSTFSSSGVDPKVAEKGAELIVGMKKSGLINYNYKNGKAYIEDMEIGSFDKDSEESMKTFTKSIPSNMMKISITDLQDKLSLMSKRLIARKSDRNQVRTTNEVLNKTNKIVKDMNALSDSQIEEIIPIALEALSQSFYPPFGVNPTIPISPAPEWTPPEPPEWADPPGPGPTRPGSRPRKPETPDPEDDDSDGIPLPPPIFTPPRHPRSRWGGGGIKGWLWRNIPRFSPRPFRGGGGGAAGVGGLGGRFRWYRDVGYFNIDTPLAQQVSNLLKDLDDLTDDLEKIDSIATSLPPQQQQQQSGPTKLDPPTPSLRGIDDWYEENPDGPRPGARPEFTDQPGPEFPPTLILPDGRKIPWNHPKYEEYRRLLGRRGLGLGIPPRPPYNPDDPEWERDNDERLRRLRNIIDNLPEELRRKLIACQANPFCNTGDLIRENPTLRGLLWWIREYGPDLRDHPTFGDYWEDILDLFPILDELAPGVQQSQQQGSSMIDALQKLIGSDAESDSPAQTAGQSSLPFDIEGGGAALQRGPGYVSPPWRRPTGTPIPPPGKGPRGRGLRPWQPGAYPTPIDIDDVNRPPVNPEREREWRRRREEWWRRTRKNKNNSPKR